MAKMLIRQNIVAFLKRKLLAKGREQGNDMIKFKPKS